MVNRTARSGLQPEPAQHDIPVDHNAMTAPDLKAMLAHFTALDGHPRTSAIEMNSWSMAAEAGQWTRAQVVAATLELTLTFTGFRIMPAHFAEAIDAVRQKVRGGWNPPDPPRELADEPQREIRWRRNACRDYMARAMVALAMGTPVEEVPMLSPRFEGRAALPPAPPGSPAEVQAREAMTAFVDRSRRAVEALTPAGEGGVRRRTRPSVADPRRMDDVRADVAARAPVPVPGDHVPSAD